MIFKKNNLPFKIKKEENIYTLKQKMRGRGDFGIDLKKVTDSNDNIYKLIRLNALGIAKGKKQRIKRVVKNIHAFNGRNSIPKLIYSDDFTIVIEWIEGDIMKRGTLNKQTVSDLARFNAENCINIKKLPVEKISKRIEKQIEELTSHNFISSDIEHHLLSFLNSGNFKDINYDYETLCFADTAPKNYIKNNNRLVYFDVFGLDQRSLTRVFTKQLTQIPKEFRLDYSNTFNESLPFKITHLIPIAYINYLVTRIYSNVKKSKYIIRKKQRVKVEMAAKDLRSFLIAIENGNDPKKWLIQQT